MTSYQQHYIDRFLNRTRELAAELVIDRKRARDYERLRHDAGALAAGLLELDLWLSQGGTLPERWQKSARAEKCPSPIPRERIDAALRAADVLVHAYECGFENSGSIAWAQLDAAYAAALEATRPRPNVAAEDVP